MVSCATFNDAPPLLSPSSPRKSGLSKKLCRCAALISSLSSAISLSLRSSSVCALFRAFSILSACSSALFVLCLRPEMVCSLSPRLLIACSSWVATGNCGKGGNIAFVLSVWKTKGEGLEYYIHCISDMNVYLLYMSVDRGTEGCMRGHVMGSLAEEMYFSVLCPKQQAIFLTIFQILHLPTLEYTLLKALNQDHLDLSPRPTHVIKSPWPLTSILIHSETQGLKLRCWGRR